MLAKRNPDNSFYNCWDLDEATHVWVTGTGLVAITPEIREELLKKCHLSMGTVSEPQLFDLPRNADGQRL
jgi:hypothetical protein